MKLTKKTTTKEVEATEVVCEITQAEFEQITAKAAAKVITKFIGDDAEIEDLVLGIHLTSLFAEFAASVSKKLFTDTNENPDKKEEK